MGVESFGGAFWLVVGWGQRTCLRSSDQKIGNLPRRKHASSPLRMLGGQCLADIIVIVKMVRIGITEREVQMVIAEMTVWLSLGSPPGLHASGLVSPTCRTSALPCQSHMNLRRP